MIKVSVIVPVYNTEKYITKCLDSLVNQTLKGIEIICVDDGSTDNSLSIIKAYAEKYKNITVVQQFHNLQGAARNNGVKIAKGEYIGYVDSDDWVDLDYFEKLYNAAQKYNSDIALATNVRIGNGKTKKRLNITAEKFVTEIQDKFDICNQTKNPCPTNKIYRKTLLDTNEIVWEEGVFCEDKIYTLKAVYYANGVVTVPNIYYYYYRNPNSTVKSRELKKFFKIDENHAKLECIKFLREKKVNICGKGILAIKKDYKSFGIPIYRIKESLNFEIQLLFAFIPIYWRKI